MWGKVLAVSVRHLSLAGYRLERATDPKYHKESGAQQHAFLGLLFGNCAKREIQTGNNARTLSRALDDTWDSEHGWNERFCE